MKKRIVTFDEFKGLVQEICRQIANDRWRPDYIVGLTRGGLLPATMISHYLEIPMKSLQVSLRDGGECVSDLGMAEADLDRATMQRASPDPSVFEASDPYVFVFYALPREESGGMLATLRRAG